jgi:tRNA U54 and U55 pseudouridine synthase Pus10
MNIEQEVTEKKVVGHICDICKESCVVKVCTDGTTNDICATLHAHWPYGSKYDTTEHICHMCESCYDKIKEFIESLGGEVAVYEYDMLTGEVLG